MGCYFFEEALADEDFFDFFLSLDNDPLYEDDFFDFLLLVEDDFLDFLLLEDLLVEDNFFVLCEEAEDFFFDNVFFLEAPFFVFEDAGFLFLEEALELFIV